MRIQHSIDITASLDRVWELTMDVEAWPKLTPTITRVERLDTGPVAIGSRAKIKQPAQSEKIWTVTELEPGRRFAWATKAMGTRMTGGHALSQTGNGTIRNTLTVDIEGPLAPVVGRILRRPILSAITKENQGFKRAAEAES